MKSYSGITLHGGKRVQPGVVATRVLAGGAIRRACAATLVARDPLAASLNVVRNDNNLSPIASKIKEVMAELRTLGDDYVDLQTELIELLKFVEHVGALVNEYISHIRRLWRIMSKIVGGYSNRLCQLAEELDSMLDMRFKLVVRKIQKREQEEV